MPTLTTDTATPPAKLAHIVLKTARYEEMIAWYKTVLGARGAFESPMLSFLTYDDEHHRVAFINMPQLADASPAAAGIDHVAFTYANLEDLLGNWRRLADLGITPVWSINHGPTTSLYYADPDGNRIELQVDNFATDDALNAWFASGAFQKNPIGVEFDPAELARRYENGEPVATLTARAD